MTKEQIEKARLLAKFYTEVADKKTGMEMKVGFSGVWKDTACGPNLQCNMEYYRVKTPRIWAYKEKTTGNLHFITDSNVAAQLSSDGYDVIQYIQESQNN